MSLRLRRELGRAPAKELAKEMLLGVSRTDVRRGGRDSRAGRKGEPTLINCRPGLMGLEARCRLEAVGQVNRAMVRKVQVGEDRMVQAADFPPWVAADFLRARAGCTAGWGARAQVRECQVREWLPEWERRAWRE